MSKRRKGERIAVILSEQDLDDLIAACLRLSVGTGPNGIKIWRKHIRRREKLATDFKRLKAFLKEKV